MASWLLSEGWKTRQSTGTGTQRTPEGQAASLGVFCVPPANTTFYPLHALESLGLDLLGSHQDLPGKKEPSSLLSISNAGKLCVHPDYTPGGIPKRTFKQR